MSEEGGGGELEVEEIPLDDIVPNRNASNSPEEGTAPPEAEEEDILQNRNASESPDVAPDPEVAQATDPPPDPTAQSNPSPDLDDTVAEDPLLPSEPEKEGAGDEKAPIVHANNISEQAETKESLVTKEPESEKAVLAAKLAEEEKFEGNGLVEEVEVVEVTPKPKFSSVVRLIQGALSGSMVMYMVVPAGFTFRYATAFDWLLMFLGAVTGICHGAALPAFVEVFGDFLNIFIRQDVTYSEAVLGVVNGSIDCTRADPFNMDLINTTQNLTFSANGITVVCPFMFTMASTVSTLVSECVRLECLDNEQFIQEVNIFVYAFIGIAVGVFTLAYFEISLFQTAAERQVKKIRLAFYRAIMRQEIGWFDANPSGELVSRISDDVDKIHNGIGDKVGLIIQWMATFVGGFVVAFIKDWRLTLLLLAFAPLLVIAGFLMSKLTTSFASQEQKQYASAGAVAQEVLSSIRTVVAFGGQDKECGRYNECLKKARKIGAKKGIGGGFSIGFVFFLFFSLDAVAFWFGAYLIQEGIVEGGDVLTVFFGVLIGAFALGQAFPNVETLLTAAGASEVIFQIIDRKSLIDPSSGEGEKPQTFAGTIQLKDISFSYPSRPDVTVMDGFNLNVEVGKTIALVGPSGCGKSTVMQLIQRFYDPSSGEVLVGGKDVRSLNTKWLRQHIGLVSQEPVLFDTTIAKNIMYGNEDATEEEMHTAAVNANAHDFISKLPDGYNTLVGEAGTQLSGGQKQRVAIARALVRDPKILLLDEATSALDTESESIVQQALDRACTGRTTIIIAHRLSTIQNADVIASVEGGKVIEQGTHSELMDKGGLYYELVTAQSYGVDEQLSQDNVTSPKRLLSHRGSHRGSRKRHHSGSESERGAERQLSKQASINREASVTEGVITKADQEKQQEEWDKDIPEVSLWRVIKKNAPEWWIIVIGLVAAFINGITFPAFAVFFGEVLDVFTLPRDQVLANVHPWAALFIVLGIVSFFSNFFKVYSFTVSGENLTSRLRYLAFKAMMRQEIGWFDEERNSTGALTTRLADDASKVQGATGTRLGTLLETMVSMFVAVVIAFVYSWVLTLVILGVVPVILVASALEVKALSGHTVANKKSLEKAGKIAVDSISNVRTVASLSLEDSFYEDYSINVERPYKKALFNCVVYGVTYAFSQAAIFLMYAVVFRFGGYQVTLSDSNIASASFDEVIVVFFALVFGAAGAGQAGAFAPNYSKAKLSSSRIFNLLDREPVIDSYSEDGEQLPKVLGEVSTTALHFNYPSRPEVAVLQGLEIDVKSGETLALVGPSGCGKSTVVSLLERFYNPISGTLTLDGTNIADLNIGWLRSQIGIVSQEPVLFDRSIADNIRYGANFREVSSEEVIEAAKAANIHNFVESLPQGYNTNVGAKGTQISGGQKQRIAIARALVRDPKILLLDEATSALDTESEKIVQEALDKAREGRTSIVIAHRLSTIYNSNCIVVISGGKAIEKGTHQELMAQKGIYYKLNKFQVVESGGASSEGL